MVTEEGVQLGELEIIAEMLASASLFSPEAADGLEELLSRVAAQAPDEFCSVTHVYSNHIDMLAKQAVAAEATLHSVEPKLGYMGAMSGVTAVASALVDPAVAAGSNILFVDVADEGGMSAVLLKKERNVLA
jgi:hypothetical protein